MTEQGVVDDPESSTGPLNEERKNRTWVFTFFVEELLDDWVDLQRINRKRQWFSLADAKLVLSLHKPALARYIDLLLEQRASR